MARPISPKDRQISLSVRLYSEHVFRQEVPTKIRDIFTKQRLGRRGGEVLCRSSDGDGQQCY